MAKSKTLEELHEEVKQKFLDKEIRHLHRILSFDDNPGTPEEIADREAKEKDEMTEIKNIKARLKYIDGLINDRKKEKGKQQPEDQEDETDTLMGKIKHMKSSVGPIVTAIPKTGSS